MTKYLLGYHGGGMPDTPTESDKVMKAWDSWMGTLAAALIDGGNPQDRRLAVPVPIPVLRGNPQLTGGERSARQDHELQEVAALDVQVLRPVDRKVLPPGWLRLGRREVRRDGDLFPLERRCVEACGRRPGQPLSSRRIDRGIDRRP